LDAAARLLFYLSAVIGCEAALIGYCSLFTVTSLHLDSVSGNGGLHLPSH